MPANLQAMPSPQIYVPSGASIIPALALDFLGRMEAAGVVPNVTQRAAVAQIVRDLQDIGLAKFAAVYLLIGGTAATHALDLMDARPITWSGGMVHDANGITGNGTNATGLINLDCSSVFGDSNFCGSCYCRSFTPGAGSTNLYGGFSAGSPTRRMYLGAFATNLAAALQAGSIPPDTASSGGNAPGFYSATITGAKAMTLYLDGSQVATGTGTSQPPTGQMGLLSVIGVSSFANANAAFYHFGPHLDSDDQSDLAAAVQQFQTTLGRAV